MTRHCDIEENWNIIVIGILISLGIIITYLPQYYKMRRNQSVYGISMWMLFLGNVANYTNFIGALLSEWKYIHCCSQVSSKSCNTVLSPLIQMAIPWLCISIYYCLYIYYQRLNLDYQTSVELLIFKSYFGIVVLIIGTIIGIILSFLDPFDSGIAIAGDVFNIISAICCVIQWAPQIKTTYQLKNIGTISLISLGLQAPGSFAIFYYQDVYYKGNLSIGVPYLVAGIQQTILFIMGYYYQYTYPLESYGTYMSHRSLQGAPTESSENLTSGQISLRIRKDNYRWGYHPIGRYRYSESSRLSSFWNKIQNSNNSRTRRRSRSGISWQIGDDNGLRDSEYSEVT